MKVILLERVAKLGQMGDVVDVKPGYARNFLLPQSKALTASQANIAGFEAQKAQLEARNLETKKEAEALAEKLDGQQFIVIRSASDAGSLYGSVTPRDAADVATEAGFSLDKKQVALKAPIKDLACMPCMCACTRKSKSTFSSTWPVRKKKPNCKRRVSRSKSWLQKLKPKLNSKSPNCSTKSVLLLRKMTTTLRRRSQQKLRKKSNLPPDCILKAAPRGGFFHCLNPHSLIKISPYPFTLSAISAAKRR